MELHIEVAPRCDQFLQRGRTSAGTACRSPAWCSRQHPVGHAAGVRQRAASLFGLQTLQARIDDRLVTVRDAALQPRCLGKLRAHRPQKFAELAADAAYLENLLRGHLAVANARKVRLDFGELRLALVERRVASAPRCRMTSVSFT